MSIPHPEYRGPKFKVRAVKLTCHRCRKSAWFHKRPHKRWVCRGDLTPTMMTEGLRPTSGFVGCGHEYEPDGSV